MLSLDRRCIGQCLFVLFTACMLATPGAQASPATEDDPSVLMSELAQILECTATDAVKDRITNGISGLINHRLQELPDAAAYAQWKVTGLSMGLPFWSPCQASSGFLGIRRISSLSRLRGHLPCSTGKH